MSQIDPPTLNTGLLIFLIIISLLLAIVDFALGVAMLTMMRGLHIVYSTLTTELKELKNSLQYILLSLNRDK